VKRIATSTRSKMLVSSIIEKSGFQWAKTSAVVNDIFRPWKAVLHLGDQYQGTDLQVR